MLFGYLFVRHAKQHVAPFIPARFLVGKEFGLMNGINFLYGVAVLGFAAPRAPLCGAAVRASRLGGRDSLDGTGTRDDRRGWVGRDDIYVAPAIGFPWLSGSQ